jgi:hypothetical protein
MIGRHRPRFSGVLNEPIILPPGLLYTSPGSAIGAQWLLRERIAKFEPLLTHYGITAKESEPWLKLAFALAVDHVEGMQVAVAPPPKGRRRDWTPSQEREFVLLVDQIRGERRRSLRDAVRVARQRRKLKAVVPTLENRYRDAKKRIKAYEAFLRRFPPLSELAKRLRDTTQK